MTAVSPAPPLEIGPNSDEAASTITVNTKAPAANFPPPKTDKPRPHVCTTCQRSFARLEHLKRHERSHTKEKPFECNQCTRCFARRDLLLRHQQKLHQATTPAARPRNRRESTASSAVSRPRKNSMVSSTGASAVAGVLANNNGDAGNMMRPRANTISHVDANGVRPTAPSLLRNMPMTMQSRHPSLSGFSMGGMDQSADQSQSFLSMSAALGLRGMSHDLLKLETDGINNADFGGLNSAASFSLFSPDFNFDDSSFGRGSGNTVNPNALHYSDSPQSMVLDPSSVFHQGVGNLHGMSATRDSFDWLTGFESQMSFNNAIDENAIDESSPSAMSTTSQSGISDVMLDGSTHLPKLAKQNSNAAAAGLPLWPQSDPSNAFPLELGSSSFSDLLSGFPMSPHDSSAALANANGPAPSGQADTGEAYLSTPPPSLSSFSPAMLTTMNPANLSLNLRGAAPETPISMNSSGCDNDYSQSANVPVSMITDTTRNAIVKALNSAALQSSSFGIRKYSFNGSGSPSSALPPTLEYPVPSTSDLQRYVGAYFRYFQPHFPFLHVSSVSFEIGSDPGFSSSASASANAQNWGDKSSMNSTVGGSGCLLLSMAAIGALYELEHEQSRTLFTMAKRMIQLYLDERRMAQVRMTYFRRLPSLDPNGQQQVEDDGSGNTPLWLVQAMLLNVVYGHNSSDKRAGEIASTHGAALVGLARGAKLLRPIRVDAEVDDLAMAFGNLEHSSLWNSGDVASVAAKAAKEQELWQRWKVMEERKRTLYAIFVLSSFLVSSYNHQPALTNSEILLDLPCDEEFFAAPTCAAFMAMGGVAAANHNRMTFHEALGDLLRASERQMRQMKGDVSVLGDMAEELRPGVFGCFILINALHNYIWETRQRHHNRIWTNEETEKMHRHIEPALQAWQRAWTHNQMHVADRQRPFLLTALSTDAVPLLDLAYVRLFVNMSRSKEKFWQRNWDGLAEELSHGTAIVQHAEQSPVSSAESSGTDPLSDQSGHSASVFVDSPATQLSASPEFGAAKMSPEAQQQSNRATSRREKHLRKAAFYAADSLSVSDKPGFTLADFSNRRVPLQAALCAFDCAQVLAEWVATLQDRVGRYLGILGHDDVDLGQVPAIMLLEEEDVKLLHKIQDMLSATEATMNVELSGIPDGKSSAATKISNRLTVQMQIGEQVGYAAKILSLTACILGKAAVWPVTNLMAECLENHAGHMRSRAEKSVTAFE